MRRSGRTSPSAVAAHSVMHSASSRAFCLTTLTSSARQASPVLGVLFLAVASVIAMLMG
jgi:hypothetical protein